MVADTYGELGGRPTGGGALLRVASGAKRSVKRDLWSTDSYRRAHGRGRRSKHPPS